MTEDGMDWGSDVQISLPVPPKDAVLVSFGTMGFTQYGIVHDLNNADLEAFIPTYVPGTNNG